MFSCVNLYVWMDVSMNMYICMYSGGMPCILCSKAARRKQKSKHPKDWLETRKKKNLNKNKNAKLNKEV